MSSVPSSPSTLWPKGMNLRKLGLGVFDVSIVMFLLIVCSKVSTLIFLMNIHE